MSAARTYRCEYCRREDSKANLRMMRARGVRFGWIAYHAACSEAREARRARPTAASPVTGGWIVWARRGVKGKRHLVLNAGATLFPASWRMRDDLAFHEAMAAQGFGYIEAVRYEVPRVGEPSAVEPLVVLERGT